MFFKNNDEYLTKEGKLTPNREEAVVVEEKMISSKITRLKIENKYLGCICGDVYLTSKEDDSSLFLFDNKKYLTIGGYCLSLNKKLTSTDKEETSNLYFEFLSQEELMLYKFKTEGIAIWKINMEMKNINIAREKILEYKHTRISNLFSENPVFTYFLKDSTLKYLLDKIYKEYHLTTFSSNTLRKEDQDRRFFHVDYPYHDLHPPFLDKILGIQVIYALDDFTIENGSTMYVPFSYNYHKFPTNVFSEKIEYMTVPKGSVILFRGDLWHSQGINITDNPRVAILANFSPLHILPKDDVLNQIISSKTDLKIENGKVYI